MDFSNLHENQPGLILIGKRDALIDGQRHIELTNVYRLWTYIVRNFTSLVVDGRLYRARQEENLANLSNERNY